MTQSRREDLSMIAILREFLGDSRKREEDMFERIPQQQLEAESRFQQFTLDVLKEIGKMFKKEWYSGPAYVIFGKYLTLLKTSVIFIYPTTE